MKSLTLTGQTETITVTDFRRAPGDVLMQAQMGKVFNITKNGVIVAVLAASEPDALELGAAVRRLYAGPGKPTSNIVAPTERKP